MVIRGSPIQISVLFPESETTRYLSDAPLNQSASGKGLEPIEIGLYVSTIEFSRIRLVHLSSDGQRQRMNHANFIKEVERRRKHEGSTVQLLGAKVWELFQSTTENSNELLAAIHNSESGVTWRILFNVRYDDQNGRACLSLTSLWNGSLIWGFEPWSYPHTPTDGFLGYEMSSV